MKSSKRGKQQGKARNKRRATRPPQRLSKQMTSTSQLAETAIEPSTVMQMAPSVVAPAMLAGSIDLGMPPDASDVTAFAPRMLEPSVTTALAEPAAFANGSGPLAVAQLEAAMVALEAVEAAVPAPIVEVIEMAPLVSQPADFSDVEEAFFAEGEALSEQYALEAAELAAKPPQPELGWFRRLLNRLFHRDPAPAFALD